MLTISPMHYPPARLYADEPSPYACAHCDRPIGETPEAIRAHVAPVCDVCFLSELQLNRLSVGTVPAALAAHLPRGGWSADPDRTLRAMQAVRRRIEGRFRINADLAEIYAEAVRWEIRIQQWCDHAALHDPRWHTSTQVRAFAEAFDLARAARGEGWFARVDPIDGGAHCDARRDLAPGVHERVGVTLYGDLPARGDRCIHGLAQSIPGDLRYGLSFDEVREILAAEPQAIPDEANWSKINARYVTERSQGRLLGVTWPVFFARETKR